MGDGAELAAAMFQLVTTNLELISNLFQLLMNNSIKSEDLWNVFYHASSFGYWFLKPFVGEGGGIDIASKNVTAMEHFANMTNYLGLNAELIFGNETGERGLSLVMKNFTSRINEEFVSQLWNTSKMGVELAMKLLENIDKIVM